MDYSSLASKRALGVFPAIGLMSPSPILF